MAMQVSELRQWLNTLEDDDEIGIDDGGLALTEVEGPAYLEIGGMPEYTCNGCGRPEADCSADPCADVIADRQA